MPKFSIIIPCFNIENYIKETVESILNQKYNDFEIILINDGSTDNTLYEMNELQKKDKRIRIFTQNNKGVSYTRNRGIEISRGEYLYFLDADDIISPKLMEEAEKVFLDSSVSIFSFGYKMQEINNIKNFYATKYDGKTFYSKDFLKLFLRYEIAQCMCSFIIKKKDFINQRFDNNLITGEDSDFQMQLLLNNDNIKVYYTAEVLFTYIRRENSITTKNMSLNSFKILDSLANLRNKMNERKILEFKEYHVTRYLGLISGLSKYGYFEDEYPEIKKKIKEYSWILKDLNFSMDRKVMILWILKNIYRVDLKLLIIFFKIVYFLKRSKKCLILV